jgi:putative ABC transport system permease protein
LALTATALVTALVSADRRYQHADVRLDYSKLLKASVFGSDTGSGSIALRPLLESIAGVGGIEAAAAYNGCTETMANTEESLQERSTTIACRVTRNYFSVMGLKPIAGRLPTEDEMSARADVVVLSRGIASRTFGSVTASVGKHIRATAAGWSKAPLLVVGVVEDIGDGLFGFDPAIMRAQDIEMRQSAVLIVRSRQEPQFVARDLGSALRSSDPRLTVTDVVTASDAISRGQIESRGRAYFLLCVALLSVTLAIVGVFGLIAYSTALRARELGIRMALGAAPARLVWMVLGGLRWSSAVGILVGLIVSARLTAWLDQIFRPGYMSAPLVTLPLAAIFASIVALIVILAVGAGVPLRRMLRMDIARSLVGSR